MIEYGVPITNDIGAEPGAVEGVVTDNLININVCEVARLAGSGEDDADTSDNYATLSRNRRTLTINVVDGCTGSDTIIVRGVRLSLVGSGATSISASVTNSGAISILGNDTLVIRSVVDPLSDDSVGVAKKLELIRHSGSGATSSSKDPPGKFRLVVEEAHVDSFDGAELNLAFSGIPENVEVELDAWLTTKAIFDGRATSAATAPKPTDAQNEIMEISPATVEFDTRMVTLTLMGNEQRTKPNTPVDPDLPDTGTPATMLSDSVDVIIIQGSISLGTTAQKAALLPLSLDIQVTVDLGEIGADDDRDEVPRFASDKTTAMTVIESTSDQTTLTAPYVLYESGFDTGIAVSNMTSGRTAQTGQVHFKFYMEGMEIEHSTPPMAPQTTMTVLLSELLGNAGHSGPFKGYMTITTDFTPGSGQVFISNFDGGFTSAVALEKDD